MNHRLPDATPAVTISSGDAIFEFRQNPGAAAVIFLPGTMLEPGHYSLLITALREAGLAVASPHFTGHGLRRKSGDFTFDSMLAECRDVENWLLTNGYPITAVCGHSQGGILALAYASLSKSLVAAFSLCAAFPQAPEAITLTRFEPFTGRREGLMKFIRKAAATFPKLPVPMPLYLSLRRVLAGATKPLYIGEGRGRISYPLKFVASLFDAAPGERLNCPWWLFAAKNDALFRPALTRTVFNRVLAPEKTLVWFEEGGHLFPMTPTGSKRVARTVACAVAARGGAINNLRHNSGASGPRFE